MPATAQRAAVWWGRADSTVEALHGSRPVLGRTAQGGRSRLIVMVRCRFRNHGSRGAESLVRTSERSPEVVCVAGVLKALGRGVRGGLGRGRGLRVGGGRRGNVQGREVHPWVLLIRREVLGFVRWLAGLGSSRSSCMCLGTCHGEGLVCHVGVGAV